MAHGLPDHKLWARSNHEHHRALSPSALVLVRPWTWGRMGYHRRPILSYYTSKADGLDGSEHWTKLWSRALFFSGAAVTSDTSWPLALPPILSQYLIYAPLLSSLFLPSPSSLLLFVQLAIQVVRLLWRPLSPWTPDAALFCFYTPPSSNTNTRIKAAKALYYVRLNLPGFRGLVCHLFFWCFHRQTPLLLNLYNTLQLLVALT